MPGSPVGLDLPIERAHSRDMFGGLAILMVFLAIGEGVSAAGIPLPGNVIGMILLSIALLSGRLSLKSVKPASDILLDNLAFLFVPPGVGIMLHFSLIQENWIPIAVAIVVSTVVVLVFVGWVQQLLGRLTSPSQRGRNESG